MTVVIIIAILAWLALDPRVVAPRRGGCARPTGDAPMPKTGPKAPMSGYHPRSER